MSLSLSICRSRRASIYRGSLGISVQVLVVVLHIWNDMHTLNSLFDCTLMASKGVVSGSGSSMAKGKFVTMEGLRIQCEVCLRQENRFVIVDYCRMFRQHETSRTGEA